MKSSLFTTVYLVRHGQSLGNVNYEKGLGHLPNTEFGSDLSELGEKQALELAKRFKTLQIDAIYSSHLTRAKKTIEPLAKQKGLTIIVEKDLREIEEENENEDEALTRFSNKLKQICEANLGATLLIVAHGVVSKLFLGTLAKEYIGSHLTNIGHVKLDYCHNKFEVIEHSGLRLMTAEETVLKPNFE